MDPEKKKSKGIDKKQIERNAKLRKGDASKTGSLDTSFPHNINNSTEISVTDESIGAVQDTGTIMESAALCPDLETEVERFYSVDDMHILESSDEISTSDSGSIVQSLAGYT